MLVAMKAKTVKQAHQIMSFGLIALWFVPMILLQFVPKERLKPLIDRLDHTDPRSVALTFMVVFFIVDTGLTVAALRRFRRTRMIAE